MIYSDGEESTSDIRIMSANVSQPSLNQSILAHMLGV
jgi:hypothetical protein